MRYCAGGQDTIPICEKNMTTKFNPEPWNRAINAALDLLFTQQHGRTMSHYANLADWSHMHNTVALAAGCTTGLSTWIHTQATEHDLIVVVTPDEAQRNRRTMAPKAPVLAVEELINMTTFYQRIYVDGASRLGPKEIDKIFRCTARTPEQRWLLLG